MPSQDTAKLKEKIISFIRIRGPSLPVHVAKDINTNMIFASAFLSELFSEKRLKTSSMKVGSSSLYFLKGQEHMLERFSTHLKSKEKEAFNLLKEKGILKDSELEIPIRVAIREIKDFAIPFHKDNEIYWRYLTFSEDEVRKTMEEKPQLVQEVKQEKPGPEKQLEITEEKKEIKKKGAKRKPRTKKKTTATKDDYFFNKVKEFLAKESIEILDIKSFSKKTLILKVSANSEEKILIAYNKKKITEKDIIEAYKKVPEQNTKYLILSLGESTKKLTNFIEAVKKLGDIKKIE